MPQVSTGLGPDRWVRRPTKGRVSRAAKAAAPKTRPTSAELPPSCSRKRGVAGKKRKCAVEKKADARETAKKLAGSPKSAAGRTSERPAAPSGVPTAPLLVKPYRRPDL